MLPQELRDYPQWLVSGEDKAPRSPKTGRLADMRDRSLFATYEEATTYAAQHGMDLGFALTRDDPFTVIDLDSPENQEQAERHKKIYEAFPTYAELSRSGNGVHIWVRGSVPRGVRRDKVEVYPHDRYIISTGKALRNTGIEDCGEVLELLFEEVAGGDFGAVELEERDALISDQEVVDMGMRATNAEKFNQLCAGDWQGEYPSQSEADFALMNMLCFYTRSNDQAKRLFRYSALGKREKAQRDKYLDYMIRKIRSEETPEVDFSALKNGGPPEESASVIENTPLQVPTEIKKQENRGAPEGEISWPPGLIGEIARYIHDSSVLPVKEVGIVASLGLMAGVLGRQYNISGTGLNLYLVLIGKTAIGKEGIASGMERLMGAVREQIPAADGFLGPASFASGQAMMRVVSEQPCFVSVQSEFGLLLQYLTDTNAVGHAAMVRRALLDLYTKSGKNDVLRPSAYSNKEKDTHVVHSPAVSLIGESTPHAFYAGLAESHVTEGFLPRFLVIEHLGERPYRNKASGQAPSAVLVDRINHAIERVLQMAHNTSFADIEIGPGADAILDAFELECHNHIVGNEIRVERDLWSRAFLKVLRVAGVLAAADRPDFPVVTEEDAQWAIDLVRRDVHTIISQFESGAVGSGESVQVAEMERLIEEYVELTYSALASTYKKYTTRQMFKDRVVPLAYLQQRAYQISAFSKDRKQIKHLVGDALEHLEQKGVVQEVPAPQVKERYSCRRVLYHVL